MERTHTERDFVLRVKVTHLTPNAADRLDSHLIRLRRELAEIEAEFGPDEMLHASVRDEIKTVDETRSSF